ncbi:hypothetical protein Ciccas_013989, partial [Cichlidogyrus casuarinus]
MYCQLNDPLMHLANLSHRYVDTDSEFALQLQLPNTSDLVESSTTTTTTTTTTEELLDSSSQNTADLSSSVSTHSLLEPKSLLDLATIKKQSKKQSTENDECLCQYCKRPVCVAGGEAFLLLNSWPWHPDCLSCSVCDENLQWEESCF